MRKVLTLALLALAAVAALLPVSATAARSHAVDATLSGYQVTTQNGYAVDADLVKDKRLGEGAGIVRSKSAGGNNIAIKFKIFFPSGMQKGVATVAFTVNPDGTFSFTGKGHYTGGTGRFKGITGQLKVDGTVATDGLTTSHVTGRAKY